MLKKASLYPILTIASCFFIYLLLSFSSWHEPLMGDNITMIRAVKGYAEPAFLNYYVKKGEINFGFHHPPLYMHLLAYFGKLFGINELSARLTGIFSYLLSLIFVYLLSIHFFKDRPQLKALAFLSCFLYAINPLAIRGSLLLDQDGTILNTALLIFIYFLSKNLFTNNFYLRTLFYGTLFACTLWMKIVAPFFLIAAILLYQLLIKKNSQNIINMISITVTGILFFAASWYLYCAINGRAFILPLPTSLLLKAATLQDTRDYTQIIRSAWAAFVYFSPSLLLLSILSTIMIFRKNWDNTSLMDVKQFAFYGIVLFFIMMILASISHGIPKRQITMLPMFAILTAAYLTEHISFNRTIVTNLTVVTFAFILFNFIFVQDPIYLLNYELKEDLILNAGKGSKHILLMEMKKILLLLSTIPLAYTAFALLRMPKAFILSLFAATIAFNTALAITQSKVNYSTVYCYGGDKVKETADFIRSRTHHNDLILAPGEFSWASNNNIQSLHFSMALVYWNDRDKFLNILKQNNIKSVSYGICANTVGQYKEVFFSNPVQDYLKSNYTLFEIGSYSVWIKNKKQTSKSFS